MIIGYLCMKIEEKGMMPRIILTLIVSLFYSNCFGEEIKNEKINIELPKDWKVGYSNNSASQIIVELIHKSESVENWTKMVTILKLPHPEDYSLEPFFSTIIKEAHNRCSELEVTDVITNEQNGYKFMQKNFDCIKKEDNRKEIFNMKIIKGIDYLYMIQFAYKVKISDEEYLDWAYYLKDAVVERIEK
jgi:hypothetical protein